MVTTNKVSAPKECPQLTGSIRNRNFYISRNRNSSNIHQMHLQCAHQWSSTWNYIQDTINNQQNIMIEKLYTKHSTTNSTLRERPYIRKQYINQHIMRITQTKLCTLISFQNPEFDGHSSSPRRNKNTGTWKRRKDVGKLKHNCLYVVIFIIKLTTCFDPCVGPSSGHKIYIRKRKLYTMSHKIWYKLTFNEISLSFSIKII